MKKSAKQPRTTTAQPKYINRQVGTELRFGGKWLREWGIEPKQQLSIRYHKGKIIIEPK